MSQYFVSESRFFGGEALNLEGGTFGNPIGRGFTPGSAWQLCHRLESREFSDFGSR
jgi:hypothetical protein